MKKGEKKEQELILGDAFIVVNLKLHLSMVSFIRDNLIWKDGTII